MKNIFFYTLFILLILSSCNNNEPSTNQKEDDSILVSDKKNINEQIDTTKLIIEGNDIWVREKPFTGEVVMKLNSGNECKIIEKGEKVQLREMFDRWYKIEFEGKTGWVFGSQTNLKTGEIIEIRDFADFLTMFITDLYNEQDLNQFINPEIGVTESSNPGAYCYGGKGNTIDRKMYKKIPAENVYGYIPKGSFCEGYPGVKDGFYFEKIKQKDLPEYMKNWADDGSIITGKIEIPDKYSGNTIIKVRIIADEFHNSYWYFLNIGTGWVIIMQDNCDCSA